MAPSTRRARAIWLLGTLGLLALGVLIGVILGNVWLGLLLGVIVSLGWLIGYESHRGRNQGIHDEDRGIEL